MPEQNKTITIVTPSLNQGQYLEQTISSVISQPGDFFIDYMIADGGSTDGSVELIKRTETALANGTAPVKCRGVSLRWWSGQDRGQTAALNNAFRAAKGGILAWINSDDYYESGTLALVLDIFLKHPEVDLVYGNCYDILPDGTIRKGETVPGGFKENLEFGCLISQPAAFFTKRVFDELGGLDESFKYCMDYDFWMRILQNHEHCQTPEHLACFRIWPGSKTFNYQELFTSEEDRIRKKYGGSKINPGAIHRWRIKSPWIQLVKNKFPRFYSWSKKIVYFSINLVRSK